MDYLSAILDFVYLKKSVVYCLSILKSLLPESICVEQAGMGYEADGYGEVTYNIEDVILMIILHTKKL